MTMVSSIYVHSTSAVTNVTNGAKVGQLLKTVARIAFCQLSQCVDHRFITPGIRLIKIHRPAQR